MPLTACRLEIGRQHRAPALGCPAAAGITRFQGIGHGLVAYQAVVKSQLFTPENRPACFDEHTAIHFIGDAIGSARMVDPTGIVATKQRINHPPIIQVKVKRVVRVTRIVRMSPNRFGHRNDFAHIFNDDFICGHVARGKHALSMDPRP